MAEYKASSPNTELLGGMIYSLWGAFPEGFQSLIKKILVKHGVADVNPQDWYRLQPVLDALKEIESTFGHHLMWQVGEQAATRAPLPPEINSFMACLFALNQTIQKIHRGGDPGGYEVKQEELPGGIVRYRVVASTPFPCSLTRGYLEGFARRFGSVDAKEVLVRHDDESPCRRQGADTCTYFVTSW